MNNEQKLQQEDRIKWQGFPDEKEIGDEDLGEIDREYEWQQECEMMEEQNHQEGE